MDDVAQNSSMKDILFWCGRFVLGGIFGYAAVLKIFDPSAFATDIGHYHLLPYPLTLGLALYLPWVELVCAVGLLCRWRERGALLLIALLCGMFFVALASAWFRGLDINCGCFGRSSVASDLPLAVARSLALGLLALFLFVRSKPAANSGP